MSESPSQLPAQILIKVLSRRDRLGGTDEALLRELPFRVRSYGRDEEIIPPGSRPLESCLILEGFTTRAHQFADGRRQMTGLNVPGDFVDLHALLLRSIDHGVVALTPCVVGFASHRALLGVIDTSPHLTRLLWLTTLIEGAIHRAWIANYSVRSSLQHLAHFVCETYLRLEAAGRASNFRFDFDISQQQLSEVMGLSAVHMNRTIQKLRQSGHFSWVGGAVHIHDFTGLAELAAFDPLYLSLSREAR